MTLTEFLLARIAEDEVAAQGANDALSDPRDVVYYWDAEWTEPVGDNAPPAYEAYVRRLSPRRVLAECEAKLQIIAMIQAVRDSGRHQSVAWALEPILGTLALPYAGHHDYDEAWRP